MNIDDDGISIGGDLFGDGSASGTGSDDEEPGDAHAVRSGVAFGLGIQHAWFRRPVRLNTGLGAGVIRRTVRGVSASADSSEKYTAPFVSADLAFAFGRRSTFMLGAMALLEFVPRVTLERNGVFQDVRVITSGPQVFVGPFLAFQWGPRGRPIEARKVPVHYGAGYAGGGDDSGAYEDD